MLGGVEAVDGGADDAIGFLFFVVGCVGEDYNDDIAAVIKAFRVMTTKFHSSLRNSLFCFQLLIILFLYEVALVAFLLP